MNFAPVPTLEELREQFGPWTPEQSAPPSAQELAVLREVIPGVSIESDRIVVPIASPIGHLGRLTLGIWAVVLCSAGAIAVTVLFAPFRPILPWFVMHTAWFLPLLLFEAHRLRFQEELIIFPSSARCRVRRGTLIVDSFHYRNLFVTLKTGIGLTPHVGHLLVRRARGRRERKAAAVAVLNRYVLFGAKAGEPAEVEGRPVFSGRFARWLLHTADCVHLDIDRLVLRVSPVGASLFIGSLVFGMWLYFFGPLFGSGFPSFMPKSHAILLVLGALSVWWYLLDFRPRLVTLLAGRRTAIVRERNGIERTYELEANPFSPKVEDSSTVLLFVEPHHFLRVRRREYRIAVVASDKEYVEELIEFLGQYLAVAARARLPVPDSEGSQ